MHITDALSALTDAFGRSVRREGAVRAAATPIRLQTAT